MNLNHPLIFRRVAADNELITLHLVDHATYAGLRDERKLHQLPN
jgi:hypothetical protein